MILQYHVFFTCQSILFPALKMWISIICFTIRQCDIVWHQSPIFHLNAPQRWTRPMRRTCRDEKSSSAWALIVSRWWWMMPTIGPRCSPWMKRLVGYPLRLPKWYDMDKCRYMVKQVFCLDGIVLVTCKLTQHLAKLNDQEWVMWSASNFWRGYIHNDVQYIHKYSTHHYTCIHAHSSTVECTKWTNDCTTRGPQCW